MENSRICPWCISSDFVPRWDRGSPCYDGFSFHSPDIQRDQFGERGPNACDARSMCFGVGFVRPARSSSSACRRLFCCIFFIHSGGFCPLSTSFQQTTTVLPAFSIFTGNLGLIGNTVYDAVHDSNATGTIAVNATTWTVDCGTLPSAASVQNCTGNYTFADGSPLIAENGNYVIEIPVDGGNGLTAPMCLIPAVLRKYKLIHR